jgi:hypothetical protein
MENFGGRASAPLFFLVRPAGRTHSGEMRRREKAEPQRMQRFAKEVNITSLVAERATK